MIRSLNAVESVSITESADVVVVGAGIAGLLIATRLSRAGKRVIVLESGGERQIEEIHPLNEVEHRRVVYSGATSGRARCLGGTSTLWGGAMIPYQPADILNANWPLLPAKLAPYVIQVEEIFGLPEGAYEIPGMLERADNRPQTYVARLAKWPAFRLRNVANLFDEELRADSGPKVWLDATATQFSFAANGRVDELIATAPNGNRIKVHAPEVVLASGAIESTRLLLLADMQANDRIFAPDDVLGRYFSDHLSVRVGHINPTNRSELNRLIGFRFEGKTMRNVRFEPAPHSVVRSVLPPGFVHISATGKEGDGSGLDALRALFRSLQRGRLGTVRISVCGRA